MLFNSIEFLIFFPIVVAAYFILSHKYRWILLLLASYYFYMCWNYKYIILILFTTLIDYYIALKMPGAKSPKQKKLYLFLSLGSNLGMLFFFKYWNFLGANLNDFLDKFNLFKGIPLFDFLLPVGISFYAFQSLSYTIDVYWGKKEPEKHLGIFALYVAFFPQLVAGPIERSTALLPQFYNKVRFEYTRIRDGFVLIVWGLFKKVVIADRLAEYANIVYNHPHDYSGMHHILATFFFSFQIYCDFSGYSDIAIGSAMILGINLMVNFRRPYFAQSIREYWQRWHISLSTWFRDYVYIPLGGNRTVKWKWYYNLFITFALSGLWHGANWTYVLWGSLNGIYIILAFITAKWRDSIALKLGLSEKSKIRHLVNIFWTFSLVSAGWFLFRANSLDETFVIVQKVLDVGSYSFNLQLYHFPADFYLSFVLIGLLVIIEIGEEKFNLVHKLSLQPRSFKWVVMVGAVFTIFILGKWNGTDFLYFQF
jgi:alginate O-acetyltransferase complex protein AlgI